MPSRSSPPEFPGGHVRRLDPARPYKPLDVGEAGVVASVDARGRLVAVTQGHPEHGSVVLDSARPLPEDRRLDPHSVRAYRRRLAARRASSFGLRQAGPMGGAGPEEPPLLLEHAVPVTVLGGRDGAFVVTFVPHPDDVGGAHGIVQLPLGEGASAGLRWAGSVRLSRASYGELTEVRTLPPIGSRPSSRAVAGGVVLYDPELGWAAAVSGVLGRVARLAIRDDCIVVDAPLEPAARAVALGLDASADQALASAEALAMDPDSALRRELARWRARWTNWPEDLGELDALARRGVSYVVGCCAIPVGETVCLVTDHRLLPLSWTRDAYFMAAALLAWSARGGPNEATELVRRHLDWLFRVADRPDGWWARSHLVGGQVKDPVFQLDQQLYPLLELADYVSATGDRGALDRHAGGVRAVLASLESRRAPGAALFATEESPADDPLALPYQTANHFLAWKTFRSLHELGFGAGQLGRLAEDVAKAVWTHQVRSSAGGRQFAYATDAPGTALECHDANDLPMALAPAWGFCPPDDPVWRSTMTRAFSSVDPAYFPGAHGGLGSLHTPGPWPLGHVQAYLVGTATGDTDMAVRARKELHRASYWDGSLPEASDPRMGRPRSRAWFAWPGAAVAYTALGLADLIGEVDGGRGVSAAVRPP